MVWQRVIRLNGISPGSLARYLIQPPVQLQPCSKMLQHQSQVQMEIGTWPGEDVPRMQVALRLATLAATRMMAMQSRQHLG